MTDVTPPKQKPRTKTHGIWLVGVWGWLGVVGGRFDAKNRVINAPQRAELPPASFSNCPYHERAAALGLWPAPPAIFLHFMEVQ